MTLIEIVISIFILSIGVLGIISLFPSGYRLSQAAIDRSVATLASQDAIARVIAQAKSSTTALPGMGSDPTTYGPANDPQHTKFKDAEPLFTVRQNDRVGMVFSVDSTCTCKFTARVCGDVTPQSVVGQAHYWPASLAGYYVVMTSGTMAGTLYKITGSSNSTGLLEFSSDTTDQWCVSFRSAGAKTGDPIRVGDQFAIIGSNTGSLNCYPTPDSFVGAKSFLTGSGATRLMKVATEGDNYAKDPWLYSYGAIVSAPTPESPRVCRVDVFVYRGVDYTNSAVKIGQTRPAGWIVTYVPNFSDFTSPDN